MMVDVLLVNGNLKVGSITVLLSYVVSKSSVATEVELHSTLYVIVTSSGDVYIVAPSIV